MKSKLALFILGIFLISFASAVCTVTFDKTSYIASETVTAEIVCTSATEKSDAYILNWTNQTGDNVEFDNGTTPSTTGQTFYESYTLPSDWPVGIFVNATLFGADLDDATDSANVTSTATATNSLLITNASVGGKWLGLTSSVKAIVKDELGKKISGGSCRFSAWSNDETTMLKSGTAQLFDGNLKFDWILDYKSFDETKDYAVLLHCYCGSSGSSTECIDEDGLVVEKSSGTAKIPFTTNSWLTIRENPLPITFVNGTDFSNPVLYAGYGEHIYYRANITNNYADSNLEIRSRAYLVNNATGKIFEEPTPKENSYGISSANTTIISIFELTNEAPTGVYYVRNFFDIYFNNLLVSQGIVNTETFNITGTDDSFSLDNVSVSKDNYYTGEYLHVCANITNGYDQRVEFDILYNYRCGSSASNFATDRSLLAEHKELRAVSAGTSQHQCASVYIPYEDHLLYKTSQCYASITISSPYINTFDNKRSSTSAQFNITDYGMYPEYEVDPSYPLVRLFPDWRRFDDVIDNVTRSYFRAKINITNLNESWLDPDDLITDNDWDVYTLFSSKMPCFTIYNYSVEYANGTAVDNPVENKAITWKKNENGEHLEEKCAIGIEEVNFSDINDDYFIVKVWYENLEERATEALEGINTKTGTFHLDVNCPTNGQIGSDITCAITAQVEDTQTVQKEVDFTCYIIDGPNIYSSINFNQMITRTPVVINQEFPVPATLSDGSQYILQCYGDYYNLGSRRDSFYDTFVASTVVSQGGGGSSSSSEIPEEDKKPSITGGATDEGGKGIDWRKIYPFGPEGKIPVIFIGSVLLLFIGILIASMFRKAKKQGYCKEDVFRKTFKIIFGSMALILIVGVILVGIYYLYKFLINSSIIQSEFAKVLIFIAFAVLMIILLFKTLNINGEIRFGGNPIRYNHDRKLTRLQNKINRSVLKDELKRTKHQKHHRVLKVKRK